MTWERESEEGGEGKGERSISSLFHLVVLFSCVLIGCFSHLPWPGIKPLTLVCWDDALPTEPPGQSLQRILLKSDSYFHVEIEYFWHTKYTEASHAVFIAENSCSAHRRQWTWSWRASLSILWERKDFFTSSSVFYIPGTEFLSRGQQWTSLVDNFFYQWFVECRSVSRHCSGSWSEAE